MVFYVYGCKGGIGVLSNRDVTPLDMILLLARVV